MIPWRYTHACNRADGLQQCLRYEAPRERMENAYRAHDIETKWQNYWESRGLHSTDLKQTSKKFYCLVMFPYPSADKLHIGHWYNYGPADTWGRFRRMQGHNVFEPIGFDAFGLPAENYAIQTGEHPRKVTQKNIAYMKTQLQAIGTMYDWTRTVVTSEPDYYRWSQWLFLQLYHRGLAYKGKAPVNWCPQCATVLANEQVIDSRCERCQSEITKQDLEQWFFRITAYADRLLNDLGDIHWPEKTKRMQANWIGRSEGAEIVFPLEEESEGITVFTTRADTLYGATYLVLAPEHPLVDRITTSEQLPEVEEYVDRARKKSYIERTAVDREKEGVFTGASALHPETQEQLPIWVSDYILLTYGTGAIMAVPAHDERDYGFAKRYQLPICEVIEPPEDAPDEPCYIGEGMMKNSGEFSGLPSEEGRRAIVDKLQSRKLGQSSVNYKLNDWLISRQRYWGAPIPIVYCDACGVTPVPEEALPVTLPDKIDLRLSTSGRSPLAALEEFVNTECPSCGAAAQREVDTMDTFVDSAWYFFRYPSAGLHDAPFDLETTKRWLPVDMYIGGQDHACGHLLYARFVTKALFDIGHITFDEPFTRLVHQGTITKDGAKMSKSRGNVVNPDTFVTKYGSDVFRLYLMFMGDYTEGGDWSDADITGVDRFLNRIWRLINLDRSEEETGELSPGERFSFERLIHQTIKKVSEDLERLHFNTAISQLMEYVNALTAYLRETPPGERDANFLQEALEALVRLLAPFAPHLAEELWEKLGNEPSIFDASWPTYDTEKLREEETVIVIQVNGRVRSRLQVPTNTSKDTIEAQARRDEKVQRWIKGKKVVKTVYVPEKLINLVVQQSP